MRRSRPSQVLAFVLAIAGCGVHVIDRWGGRPVVRRHVDAPVDSLWARIQDTAPRLGLVVTAIHPEKRIVEFDWVTAPGDGRLYLRCRGADVVGSASFQPRVHVVREGEGSAVIIGTLVRATIPASCESTGQFESWLLDRLEPAIAAAAGDEPEPGGGPAPGPEESPPDVVRDPPKARTPRSATGGGS